MAVMTRPKCTVSGCERPSTPGRKGWCSMHYQRWKRTGDPGDAAPAYMRAPLSERFWSKVDKQGPDECWQWLAAKQRNGYGVIGLGGHDGRMVRTHRVSYELAHGPIPEGLIIDHLCRNRGCVNPAHLEAVDQRTNLLRGTGASARNHVKSTCPQGHPYSGVNSRGDRICHTCLAAAARRGKARRRAARTRYLSTERIEGLR